MVAAVWTVGDPVLGRIDTSGSALALPAGETDTSLLVATVSPWRRWITTDERPQDFPFAVSVGGCTVVVESIAGVTSPQTFTLAGPVGVTLPVATDVRIARQAVDG